MDCFVARTGRAHSRFEYRGSPGAESVIVIMGSGAETVAATVDALGSSARVGMLTVTLYRPFSVDHFLAALPPTVRAIAVLNRTKEPGAIGEPLYQDVVTALHEGAGVAPIRVIGGRYGLGSKKFTPAMVKAVFAELVKDTPKQHFIVGIMLHQELAGRAGGQA
jgi:pyruvate-ferredoxin/flavodoxin oxidoreductase